MILIFNFPLIHSFKKANNNANNTYLDIHNMRVFANSCSKIFRKIHLVFV